MMLRHYLLYLVGVCAAFISCSSENVDLSFGQINQQGLLTNNTFFTLNGTELRILSGAVHYFRIPHQYWQDRLERLKALGLNTVETYVAWNVHEPSPGNYRFEGDLDVRTFIQTAQRMGLHVILRPGPYICAEWEFGGLPSWLLRDANMRVRTLYAPFMQAVDTWFGALFKQVGDLQHMRGGPIIAMQVENEYGHFGSDTDFLKTLVNIMLKHGSTELLFTGDNLHQMADGGIPGMFSALTTGDNAGPLLTRQVRERTSPAPLYVAEFWTGWFDHWGEPKRHLGRVDVILRELKAIAVDNNASVNLYMGVGGTNFGFMNGANIQPTSSNKNWYYGGTVTSYDYDSIIGEDGSLHLTKFSRVRSFFGKLPGAPALPPMPAPPRRRAYGSFAPNGFLPLFPEHGKNSVSMLSFVEQVQYNSDVKPMELLDINNGGGQQYGYILYRRNLQSNISGNGTLSIEGGVHDRLTVVYGGVQQGSTYPINLAMKHDDVVNVPLSVPNSGVKKRQFSARKNFLNILVENRGRINFVLKEWLPDPKQVFNSQRKGLQGNVTLITDKSGSVPLLQWDIYPLDFKRKYLQELGTNRTAFQAISNNSIALKRANFPAMLRYEFELGTVGDELQDSFLYLPFDTIAKGVAFVNGHNIGRFWSIGPQKSLYVPKWYWRHGEKQSIMLFVEEVQPNKMTEGLTGEDLEIELKARPDLGPIGLYGGGGSLSDISANRLTAARRKQHLTARNVQLKKI